MPDPNPPTHPAPRGGLRVVVIDGHADSAESLAILLDLWGHQPVTAADGLAALALLDAFIPDVILLEVLLGGLDGWGLTQHVRMRPEFAATKIVVVTGQSRDRDRRQSFAAGADFHFVKPIDPNELEELLDHWRNQRPTP